MENPESLKVLNISRFWIKVKRELICLVYATEENTKISNPFKRISSKILIEIIDKS